MKENVGKLTYPMLFYIWQESICIECTKYFDFKTGKTPKKSSHRNLLQVCSSTFLSLPTTKF